MERSEVTHDDYECGAGWFSVIDNALDRMFDTDPDLEVLQIKEKFGGLRIYFSTRGSDAVVEKLRDTVAEAEKLCDQTCEICGSTDGVEARGRSWMRTICANHDK